MKEKSEEINHPTRAEIFSVERLEEYSSELAIQFQISQHFKCGPHLLSRMHKNGKILLKAYLTFSKAVRTQETLTPTVEWLADNFHIIEAQFGEIRRDSSSRFFRKLPRISMGEFAGYPRIYALASELLAHTENRLDTTTLFRYLQAFQKTTPLKIAELWALSPILKLVLIENLTQFSSQISRDCENRFRANHLVDQLRENVEDKTKFVQLISQIPCFCVQSIESEHAFIAEFAKRLRDQDPDYWPALDKLEKHLLQKHFTLEQIVRLDHQVQASNQVGVANIITSMRLLSSLDWQVFFERLSLVDRVLETDPEGSYPKMDFGSRNQYRTIIEKMAVKNKDSELDLAKKMVQFAKDSQLKAPHDRLRSHVGYYLIGDGNRMINKTLRFIQIGSSSRLLKLDLTPGIPPQGRTIIVISAFVDCEKMVQELIEKMEVHYLGNSDPQLFFAILANVSDAALNYFLLEVAKKGVAKLNQKYGYKNSIRKNEDLFFLFHQNKQKPKFEELHELNRNLSSNQNTGLSNINFVIILGADTELPRNVARKLIGAALHPLNRVYTIIQPKISISPNRPPKFQLFMPRFHKAAPFLYDIDAFESGLTKVAHSDEIELYHENPQYGQSQQWSTWLKNKWKRKQLPLNEAERQFLRLIARRTWNYFDTFVNEEENSLPPDNYQEDPKPMVAHRTSPTNIGVYLLSLVSARDFGYLNPSTFMRRLGATLESMKKLEQFQGHYFNWYDTQTLNPLQPQYISTADSGNLAGHLLAVKQACLEIPNSAVMNSAAISGLADTISIIDREIREILKHENSSPLILRCKNILSAPPPILFSDWGVLLRSLMKCLEEFRESSWTSSCLRQVQHLLDDLKTFAPWTNENFSEFQDPQITSVTKDLDQSLTFSSLSSAIDRAIPSLEQRIGIRSEFIIALKNAKLEIAHLLSDADDFVLFFTKVFEEMDFGFLLDKERGIFAIGYSVNERKHDTGVYDLLASESRLASFVAIAKGNVPQKHWFRLGRQRISTPNGRALTSWSASMFEYLMPLLVMRTYENNLLDETFHTIISKQISYGKERRVPWGVSEACYNARDLQCNYQYGPFGIPGLGLKRGLGHDLVISPYSTLLAAMVNPTVAIKNLKQLISQQLLREFGFYESIDYTAERVPENQKFATIKTFMAHHQGMSLVAINNVIHQNIMQTRFHREPGVKATQLLLRERIPKGPIPMLPKKIELEMDPKMSGSLNPGVRQYHDPNISSPFVQLLSNDHYTVMLSTSGAGYSKFGNIAMTRWSEDSTRDQWGSFIFIKDISNGKAWSTGYQPSTQVVPESYCANFREDKVDFQRRDGEISTHTEIVVSAEDNVEIRQVSLTNHSSDSKIFEVTSYLEPVLEPFANDLDHPAFSKLFIQSEFFPTRNALLAKRRKQNNQEKEFWGLHVVASDRTFVSDLQYETNRENFIGRGRTIQNPGAIFDGKDLSNISGATLDPILSLRCRIKLLPGEIARIAFTTGIASSREEAIKLADRYHDIHSFDRESKLAWTKSQVDLRHLNIDSETVYLFQRVAERLLYSDPSSGAVNHPLPPHQQSQLNLWCYGISGDLPIVVVSINDGRDMTIIRKLLRCHEYLRLKGLIYDFIILNEQGQTYIQELQEQLQQQIRVTGSEPWLNKPGGVFILRADITPLEHRTYIQSLARVSLFADSPLKDQIDIRAIQVQYPPEFRPSKKKQDDEIQDLPVPKINFFNEFGGFNDRDREYMIVLSAGQWTPAPWVNVIGNQSEFGFQVSETGAGFTWSLNSQINRLTPWSNDPVSDPSGEIIYLRDEETGEVWTPTPLPIRGKSNYIVKHGQGYTTFDHVNSGFHSTLTSFVPKNDTVKVSILQLKNLSNRKRKISITSYTEWVLGTQKQKSSPHLICEVDSKSGAIFAQNPYENDFSNRVAFADISETNNRTFTYSRKEFLGRNGNYAEPAALRRQSLSQKTETGQDPCAALQSTVEFQPCEIHETIILLGQCENSEKARELTLRYREIALARKAFEEVTNHWGKWVNTIQVKTPDPAMDTLMNGWLFYQTLSCRFWSRTAFYQSGGAYGFRDQLQDCMALVYSAPHLAREHILRASGRQFKEGDVQHWWHPPSGRGIRTRISDDLLWLPFVVSFYIEVTGDQSVLAEKIPFLKAPLLNPGQEDSYTLPHVSSESVTVFEHCIRAIDRSFSFGDHGLPLMGTGDWNDSMNRVGTQGKGESIWLGWFLSKVIQDFLPFCNNPEQSTRKENYEIQLKKLKQAIEENGWDGEWYRRAYFDDGTPLGSSTNEECKIDSIAQTWAILSGTGDPARTAKAMEKFDELLIRKDSKLILLLTPPFDKSSTDPGYIKGYVPGVRENGGQYTHAAVWAIMAYAKMGNGNKAMESFNLLNPINHSLQKFDSEKYKIEPYVLAGDVYAGSSHEGRGGWSWYTGSASWYYRAGLESILGFHLRGNKLKVEPCIPNTWKFFEIVYIYRSTKYSIRVENPLELNQGISIIHLDGNLLANSEIDLVDDKIEHRILVKLNKPIESNLMQ